MPTLLALSPHLDDAVFSAGGTLHQYAKEGWKVVIATCFTGNVAQPLGFALSCQLDKGIAANVDYMALRRKEDLEACRILGVNALHLPLLEAPHRGYDTAAALFCPRLTQDTVSISLRPELIDLVRSLCPAAVFAPAAIGNHVDHWVVRDVIAAMITDGFLDRACVKLWSDWPYADKTSTQSNNPSETRLLSAVDIDAKIAAASAYASQLSYQFGSRGAMANRIAEKTSEIFWQF